MAFMKIKPTDSLYFGGGKPFDAGVESWTDSSFLPNPSVIWGALFSVLFREGKVTSADKTKLQITNIYLYQEQNRVLNFLVPTPLDVYIDEQGNNYISKVKKIDDSFISNYPLKYISILERDNIDVADNSLVKIDSLFKFYTIGSELPLYPYSKIFIQDYKIGIKIDKDLKTAKKKHLYRIDLTQFIEENESGFLIEYELKDKEFSSNSGLLKFGGEGKTAKYQIIKEATRSLKRLEKQRDKSIEKIEKDGYFKLYFKTHAFLNDDWKPNKIDGLKLLSANVGKYISIGGWDMEKNEPKEMKKYIPAGSVYVYKIEKQGIDFKKLIEDEINSYKESYKGFGLFELLSIKEKIDE